MPTPTIPIDAISIKLLRREGEAAAVDVEANLLLNTEETGFLNRLFSASIILTKLMHTKKAVQPNFHSSTATFSAGDSGLRRFEL